MNTQTTLILELTISWFIKSHNLSSLVLLSHHINCFLSTIKIELVVLFLFLNFDTICCLTWWIIIRIFGESSSISLPLLLLITILLILTCHSSILTLNLIHSWKKEFTTLTRRRIASSTSFWIFSLFRCYLIDIIDTILH
jgi:hypothetical protein